MAVTYQDIIPLPLTENDILEAISRAQHSTLLDNLRMRHPNIQFDCKVRGFIGEIALKHWFASHNLYFNKVNYLADASGIDIDLIYGLGATPLNIEVKTSLIPDEWRNLQTCLQKGDIKLIRRGRQTIEQLRGDIHMQIYYRQRRKAKDNWLARQGVDLHHWSEKTLYHSLLGKAYLDNIFLVGWMDTISLKQRLSSLPAPECTWQFPGSSRKFWKCSIAQSHKPLLLIDFLKAYQQDSSQLTQKAA